MNGYICGALFEELYQRGLQLITRCRKNMKNRLMPLMDRIMLRKRAIIESLEFSSESVGRISSLYLSSHHIMSA